MQKINRMCPHACRVQYLGPFAAINPALRRRGLATRLIIVIYLMGLLSHPCNNYYIVPTGINIAIRVDDAGCVRLALKIDPDTSNYLHVY